MPTHEAIETINYAAAQNDRWMFVALLVIGLIFVVVLIRFFMQRFDDLQERVDVQQQKFERQNSEFVDHLQRNNRDMLEIIATAHSTIAKNTLLMERVEKRLDSL